MLQTRTITPLPLLSTHLIFRKQVRLHKRLWSLSSLFTWHNCSESKCRFGPSSLSELSLDEAQRQHFLAAKFLFCFSPCLFFTIPTMNFLRRTKEQFKTEIVGEKDDGSRYFDGDDLSEYEHSTKKAAEMELILGNALAVHERDNGSIHSLERYGSHSAIEVGRRIATMQSKDDWDSQLGKADSFGLDSRTSSIGSVASLPTFVKVQRGDSVLSAQRSWDEEQYDARSLVDSVPKATGRSWNKLRREVYEESRATYNEEDNIEPKRSQSIGRKALGFGKKILRDTSNRSSNGYGVKQHSESEPIRRSFAKDYNVEVSLKNKKKFWERQPSLIKAALAKKEKLKNNNNNGKMEANEERNQTGRKEPFVRNWSDRQKGDTRKSHDAPKLDVVESSLVESGPKIVLDMQEMHEGDLLFQALEVACCASLDGDTLDMITDMVPPRL